MSYHGMGSNEAADAINQSNSKAMSLAFDRLEVDAKYAGPISKAESTILNALFEQGKQGQLPTAKQVGSAAAGAAVAVSSVAATAACAPTLGPGAPLCGMAAGYVASAIADVFVGGSEDCNVRVNGTCWWDVKERYLAMAADQMAPGDIVSRTDIKKALQGLFALVDQRIAYEQQHAWDKKTWFPGAVLGVAGKSTPAAAQPPGLALQEGLSLADVMIARAAIVSRYEAERRFLEGVRAAAATAQAGYLAACPGASCQSQVKGITLQGAYLAGKALRTPAEGAQAADMIWESTRLQDDGVVGNASTVSSLQRDLAYQDTARKLAAARLAAQAKADAALRSPVTQEAVAAQSSNRAMVAVGLLLAAGVGTYLYTRRR